MNRRRFLGLVGVVAGALLAPFRSGETRGLKSWKTLPDPTPRQHVDAIPLGRSFYARVAPGREVRVGDLLESLGDGRLIKVTGVRSKDYPMFCALKPSPASIEDRRAVVGMIE